MNFHNTTPNPYYDFGPNHYRNDPFYHFEYLTQEIRVVPGPQSDLFTSRGIDTFYKERYQVSAQTDRMAAASMARKSNRAAVPTSFPTALRWVRSKSPHKAPPS